MENCGEEVNGVHAARFQYIYACEMRKPFRVGKRSMRTLRGMFSRIEQNNNRCAYIAVREMQRQDGEKATRLPRKKKLKLMGRVR
jgi:hypothetical protein